MRPISLATTICILCSFCLGASAQEDTLPHFQVFNTQGRIIVAFYNPFQAALQINIERSHDSTRNFSTIYDQSDPKHGNVTFIDTKTPNDHMYYRVFIQLQGSYSFTPSQMPMVLIEAPPLIKQAADAVAVASTPVIRRKPEWEPSTHIFTDDYGNVKVELPSPGSIKYAIKFYDDQQNFIFELPEIKELPLTIDKSNFLHAGWFFFELYEDGVLKEKNKFLLSRDN
jgi:hypothetical protein